MKGFNILLSIPQKRVHVKKVIFLAYYTSVSSALGNRHRSMCLLRNYRWKLKLLPASLKTSWTSSISPWCLLFSWSSSSRVKGWPFSNLSLRLRAALFSSIFISSLLRFLFSLSSFSNWPDSKRSFKEMFLPCKQKYLSQHR